MSEMKEYISRPQENGAVHISEEVLMAVAGTAASEVEGVAALSATRSVDLGELIGKKNAGKGIRITISEEDEVSIECNIVVALGANVLDTAKAVQDAVISAVESVTGIKISNVHVMVCGISLPKEKK